MSSPWLIQPVTLADSSALAANNMPAFWDDPHWVLSWKHRTLSYHISQIALRIPRVLVTDRATRRHQKAIDPVSGKLVGYARWALPEGRARLPDGTPVWPDAMGPEVSAEEEAEIIRVAEGAHFDPNEEMDHLSDHVLKKKKEILARKEYMLLDYLAVHPDNQRKGIGAAFIRSGTEVAEKLGLDVFIYAKSKGVGLYKRFGFRVEWDDVVDDSAYGGTGEVYVALMIYEQKRSDK
ncbi:acetyltransferase [Coniochaeta sp. 2T2.1]|nr:acetyltransferase [Coniochaeta sp. 2T2.1]